ncbi:putative membrane protein [Vibrio phage vB_VchM_Kuja]|uniref:Putative membrane protein n=1 Tax=Vibrio phage vB_VchM_Kuja TaxID=2686437 RepID=A0A6B9J5E2_9CAUD|nr:hypothetical protein HWC83_gp136 [Vibrio phage vB_VchM_Kuja]QGZ16091.1 putative membrane protein [Vibrio phage vB_VchM_Kuja]
MAVAIGVLIFVIVSIIISLTLARFMATVKRDTKLLIGLIDLKFDDPEVKNVIVFSKQNSMSGRFIVEELGEVGIPVEDYFLTDTSIRTDIEEHVSKLGYKIHFEFDGKFLDHLRIYK